MNKNKTPLFIYTLFNSEEEYLNNLLSNIYTKQLELTSVSNFTYKGNVYFGSNQKEIVPLNKSLRKDMQLYLLESERISKEYATVVNFIQQKDNYIDYIPKNLRNYFNLVCIEDRTNELPENVHNILLEKSLNLLLE